MSGQGRQTKLGPVERLLEVGAIGALTDGELLERFAAQPGEEAELAFSILVGRHGGSVLSTCQGILGNKEDSLDAFQATFLILARKARAVRVDDSLAPWLNRVARHTALRAKRSAARRVSVEKEASRVARSLPGDRDRAEFWSVVREAVERLDSRYRAPVVLCDLEGKSYQEAAQHLGCPIGTVRSRLARGRERLRSLLMRRGLGPSLLTGTPLNSPEVRDVMTPTLVDLVTRFATHSTAAGAASAHPAAILAEGVLKIMKLNRLTAAAAVLLVIVSGGATLGAWAISVQGGEAVQSKSVPSAQVDTPRKSADLASIRKKLEHDWASLKTLEFSVEERFRDPDERRAYSSYRTDYFLGLDDRRTVSTTFFGPGGLPEFRDEVRSDGTATYHLGSERGKPDVVQQVTIDDQTDQRDRYAGLMCSPLWLWTPGGRPLAALLSSGGKLVVERDTKGGERVILVAKNPRWGRGEVRCELDADHGWAPRRVELTDVSTRDVWEVKKFTLVDGRWFPAEGRYTGVQSTDFKVIEWHVNRPIAGEKFGLPELPKGFRVFDHGNVIDAPRRVGS